MKKSWNSFTWIFSGRMRNLRIKFSQFKSDIKLILDFNLKSLSPVVSELVQFNHIPVVISMVYVKMKMKTPVILMVFHLRRSPPVMDLKTFHPL